MMGKHNKDSVKKYRKKQKQVKQKKKSILNRGNQLCNTGFKSTSTITTSINTTCESELDTLSSISGIETLTTSSRDLEEGNDNNISTTKSSETVARPCNTTQEKATRPQNVQDPKKLRLNHRQTLCREIVTDPLYVRFQEYKLLHNRMSQLRVSKI